MATYEETQQALRDAIAQLAPKAADTGVPGGATAFAASAEHLANAARALSEAYNVPPAEGD